MKRIRFQKSYHIMPDIALQITTQLVDQSISAPCVACGAVESPGWAHNVTYRSVRPIVAPLWVGQEEKVCSACKDGMTECVDANLLRNL